MWVCTKISIAVPKCLLLVLRAIILLAALAYPRDLSQSTTIGGACETICCYNSIYDLKLCSIIAPIVWYHLTQPNSAQTLMHACVRVILQYFVSLWYRHGKNGHIKLSAVIFLSHPPHSVQERKLKLQTTLYELEQTYCITDKILLVKSFIVVAVVIVLFFLSGVIPHFLGLGMWPCSYQLLPFNK